MTAASIVESALLLPMMASRRVVIVLRAERLLKPKRKGRPTKAQDEGAGDADGSVANADALERYVKSPERRRCSSWLPLMSIAPDGCKAPQKEATIVGAGA